MSSYNHISNTKIMLSRSYDRMCFGTYKAVNTLSHKVWRIAKGEVQIKFRGKWWNVEETRERLTTMERDNNIGRFNYRITGVVEISNWSQH